MAETTSPSRQACHHRLRPRRLYGRDLCGPRHAGADPDPGHPAGRPAHHHHRRGELSGLRRRHPGPLADGADAEAGRACRHQDRHRPRQRPRPDAAAVPADLRFRRNLPRRRRGAGDRRAGALARSAVGAEVQGLRRVRLRHLRRLLLQEQGSDRDRRRQHRGRGGAVPHQLRLQGHGGAPARRIPRREDSPGPPVQAPQDQRDLGFGAARRDRQREPAQGPRRRAEERQDRRDPGDDRRRRVHRHRPFALDRARRRQDQDEAERLRLDRALFDRDLGAGPVRRRRRHRRHLPPGGDRGGPWLHGGARSRKIPRAHGAQQQHAAE